MEYKEPSTAEGIKARLKEIESDEEEFEPGQEEEHRQSEYPLYSLPTLRIDIEKDKMLLISLTASGSSDVEARKSFDKLVKLMNEKVSFNGKVTTKEEKEERKYLG